MNFVRFLYIFTLTCTPLALGMEKKEEKIITPVEQTATQVNRSYSWESWISDSWFFNGTANNVLYELKYQKFNGNPQRISYALSELRYKGDGLRIYEIVSKCDTQKIPLTDQVVTQEIGATYYALCRIFYALTSEVAASFQSIYDEVEHEEAYDEKTNKNDSICAKIISHNQTGLHTLRTNNNTRKLLKKHFRPDSQSCYSQIPEGTYKNPREMVAVVVAMNFRENSSMYTRLSTIFPPKEKEPTHRKSRVEDSNSST